jgi:RNA polymerase sigma-70 factor (ECF subfamily)
VNDAHRNERQATHQPLNEATVLNGDNEVDLTRRVERRLEADCLTAALKHLTEDQRQVILLKFIEGLNNAQVARLLSKTEGAAKSLQHRALGSLRRAIERERCYEA